MYIIEIPPLDIIQEGKVLSWTKHVGDPVQKGDPLVEIETNKIHMEIESPASGVLRAILAPAHTSVVVGTFIALVGGTNEPFSETYPFRTSLNDVRFLLPREEFHERFRARQCSSLHRRSCSRRTCGTHDTGSLLSCCCECLRSIVVPIRDIAAILADKHPL